MKKLFYSLLIFLSLYGYTQTTSPPKPIKANEKRIEQRILELAKFGQDSAGRGNRVAYTQGNRDGRSWYMGLLKKAGLEVSIDFAGNIIGKRKGTNPTLKPIGFGSHLDMFPLGGNYDGCVGSIAALEMIEILNENKINTNHSLEVIIFSNEEGGTVGSSMFTKVYSPEELNAISQSGFSIIEGIKSIGGKPDSLKQLIRNKGDLAAFLELHIEQGGILEKESIQIGVVEGIVGIIDWEVTIQGIPNHAGTTPMNIRQDALLAAAKFIVAVNEVITSHEGKQVGTVGKIKAEPGASNVIPGKVVLGMEIRDISFDKIESLFNEIKQKANAIGASSGTRLSFRQPYKPIHPALTDKSIQSKIETAAKALGLSYKYMQSGAGHDLQEMSLIAPVGMIFVPSIGGISHSPKEFTQPGDMANGANVLLQTILAIDKD